MSKTPRTDAVIAQANFVPGDVIDLCYKLEEQLAERDAALARCVEALTYYANLREIYSGDELWKYAEQVVTNITTSAQATAKAEALEEDSDFFLKGNVFRPPNRSAATFLKMKAAEYRAKAKETK